MTNPLLSLQLPLPFDVVEPEHIVPAISEHLRKARLALDNIATTKEVDYESSFEALEKATERLELSMGMVEHLESVQTSDKLRAAYNEVLPGVSEFYSSIALHPGVYQTLQRFAEYAAEHNQALKLNSSQLRFMKKTLEEFERHGAKLNSADKSKLQKVDRDLSEKTTAFSQNVLDGANDFELIVEKSRLKGLPEFAIIAAQESAEAKGKSGYRLTLQAPSVVPLLTYAEDPSLRMEVWRAFNARGRGKNDNLPLVKEILSLRKKRAQLLGFKNFADLATVDRMAQTGEKAAQFVHELREKTQGAFEREQKELLAFRRELEGETAPELNPWDVAYYAEKQRRKLYDFDEELLRPYLSASQVLRGAFQLAEKLYGIKIEDVELPLWDSSANGHRITSRDGVELGVFYTDLYPRESKRDGAWMHGLVASTPPTPHVALFCLNAQPPTKTAPSLMSFRDVETVFHEFGHLLHHCLSEVSVRSLACTRVAQDFVELPSQIMENWCSEKEALDEFALHYETGEKLPQQLVERMLTARNFRAASAQMRQLGFAAMDLALHREFDPEGDVDPNTFANGILEKYSPTKLPENYALIASFSHLFSHPIGYAAGYYSYKWAEVLDADAFSRFKKEGLFSPRVGQEFRKSILSRGDSADPLELFKEFMGREPQVEPMLARQGLIPSA